MKGAIISGIVDEENGTFTLEEATWRDLRSLRDLERECFGQDAWALLELLGVLTIPGVVRLKAVGRGNMVGFIAGDPKREEKTGWILTLGVLPAWRRMGIAETLLGECERLMEMPRIKLTVRRGNDPAIHLYEKMGYRQINIWPKYYKSGEDGLVFEKVFPNSGS